MNLILCAFVQRVIQLCLFHRKVRLNYSVMNMNEYMNIYEYEYMNIKNGKN